MSVDDVKRGKLPSEDFEFLASIIKKKTQRGDGTSFKDLVFTMTAPEAPVVTELKEESSYLSVKTLKHSDGTSGYCLVPGTIIRLGRLSFLVIECRNSQKS